MKKKEDGRRRKTKQRMGKQVHPSMNGECWELFILVHEKTHLGLCLKADKNRRGVLHHYHLHQFEISASHLCRGTHLEIENFHLFRPPYLFNWHTNAHETGWNITPLSIKKPDIGPKLCPHRSLFLLGQKSKIQSTSESENKNTDSENWGVQPQ